MAYQTGDTVWHWKFGRGQIIDVEEAEIFTVDFDTHGRELIEGASYLQHADATLFDEATFVDDDDSVEHLLGARWEPVFDNADDVMGQLETMLEQATIAGGYATTYAGPYNPADGWPKTFLLAWPAPHDGVHLVVVAGEQSNNLVGFYPFTSQGGEHSATLARVHVWASGAEAQLALEWGPAQVTAFDIQYPVNRGWYRAGNSYQFMLTGIAYEALPADDTPMQIPVDSPGGRALAVASGRIPGRNVEVSWDGAAILLPTEGGEADDYSFRGPIQSVRDTQMLGQPAWLARTTVMRDTDGDDIDYDLDILLTARSWRNEQPPQAGMDIEGALWLQAYLWQPHSG